MQMSWVGCAAPGAEECIRRVQPYMQYDNTALQYECVDAVAALLLTLAEAAVEELHPISENRDRPRRGCSQGPSGAALNRGDMQ